MEGGQSQKNHPIMQKKKKYQIASCSSVKKKYFVTLLQLHTDSHDGKRKGWTAEAWAKISNGMHTRFPAFSFSMKQLKQLERSLRNKFKLIKDIERQAGFAFDQDEHKIVASNDDWVQLLKSNPKARRFRTRLLPYYVGLEALYNEGSMEPTNSQDDCKTGEESSSLQIEPTTIGTQLQDGKKEERESNSLQIEATISACVQHVLGRSDEQDFSMEGCIAKYYELPAAVRKGFDFTQVLEIFEYETVRKLFIDFPESRFGYCCKVAWLSDGIKHLMRKKWLGLIEQQQQQHQQQPYQYQLQYQQYQLYQQHQLQQYHHLAGSSDNSWSRSTSHSTFVSGYNYQFPFL